MLDDLLGNSASKVASPYTYTKFGKKNIHVKLHKNNAIFKLNGTNLKLGLIKSSGLTHQLFIFDIVSVFCHTQDKYKWKAFRNFACLSTF